VDEWNSRRNILKGTAAAGAALVAESATGQRRTGEAIAPTPRANPKTRFTNEPFVEQKQEWPALQREMKPVPDSGEQSYSGSERLKGRKALITGGDSGIGRAAAIAFAREGADVAINYYPTKEPDAQDLSNLMQAEGRKVVLLPGDLTDREFCINLVGQANRKLGGIDILVNNAAYQQSKSSIEEISFDQFDRTLKTNLYAMFYITKTAVSLMKPGAVIINTTSVNAVDPSEDLLDYATTKAGIAIFTKGLAKQLAKKGIRVNGVAPGPIWTPLQVAGGQLPGTLGEFGQDTPLGRAGQPVELAGLYVALASDELSYTHGSIFGANGGTGTI
jgi:NAD(P)-dependent dehydrogenase (short-subunit alcohol dehydrogenase family)